MTLRTRLAGSTLAASVLVAATGAAAPAVAASPRSVATIEVAFDGDLVDVTSSKDLSNVVLVFCDGEEVKFDGLDGTTGAFTGEGDHAGATIAAVYVKSGSFRSGDGPGYGARFDAAADACTASDEDVVGGADGEGEPEPLPDWLLEELLGGGGPAT